MKAKKEVKKPVKKVVKESVKKYKFTIEQILSMADYTIKLEFDKKDHTSARALVETAIIFARR